MKGKAACDDRLNPPPVSVTQAPQQSGDGGKRKPSIVVRSYLCIKQMLSIKPFDLVAFPGG